MPTAAICKQLGEPLRLADVVSAPLKAHQLRINIHCAGVNFADTLMLKGQYQTKPPLPFSPGSELSGIVSEVGGDVSGWQVGDRVMASVDYGAYASEIVIDADRALKVPENLSMANAAAFPVVWGSALYGLKQRGNVRRGETLLVLGASGGIGLAAVQLGKWLGATVIAAASSEEKLQTAADYGADHLLNYREQEIKLFCKELTDGKGIDVVFDAVGGDAGQAGLKSLAWGGRLLVIGFASGTIPDFPANWTLIKNSSIVGVFWGAWAQREPKAAAGNIQQMLDGFANGELQPMTNQQYSLEQANEALADIAARKVVGKAVLITAHFQP